jgi:hypothetical protein
VGLIADSVGKGPRVLVYDIETRPMCSLHWAARDQNMTPEQVLDPGGVLCWSARWLDEKRIRYAGDHHDGHEAMVHGIYELLDAAEIVIGYNQVAFDDRRVNDEFKRLGLPAPSPVKSIDLLRAVRARFGYPIKKLQSVGVELGVGRKVPHTGWAMWKACILNEDGAPYFGPVPVGGGDKRSWDLMRRYCKGDVQLTTDVYWALRDGGWIKNHPHMGMYANGNRDGCPVCGSDDLEPNGTTVANTQVYGKLRCRQCGANARTARSTGVRTTTRGI